jgi:hypothetical protein
MAGNRDGAGNGEQGNERTRDLGNEEQRETVTGPRASYFRLKNSLMSGADAEALGGFERLSTSITVRSMFWCW